ncbi:MAG: NAD-dependent epimerase/dehydratase family protein [Alphaproteobacteria bacterium]|nr:NAD-dependent epimerase/dehydratase family protein [Alphaproteobacteria bacterium]
MSVLVTGAAGFVGRHLVAALRERGTPVRRLVRTHDGETDTVAHDLCAGAPPDAAWEGVSAVVHAAARVPADLRDPGEARACLEVNALATLSLAEACRERGVRLVFLSSGNVYAPGAAAVAEDAPVWPAHRATYYLASKLCAELYVAHAATRGLNAVTLRLSSVYGPGTKGGVVAIFLRRLAAGEPLQASRGPYRADLVEVSSVVSAVLAALEHPEVQGLVNVGSGRPTGMDELATTFAEVAGRPELVRVVPQEGSDPGFAPLDVTRASTLLGYRPLPLRDGLRRMWELR